MSDNGNRHHLARSAAIVSTGNIISRVMGLVRDTAIAGVFGARAGDWGARRLPVVIADARRPEVLLEVSSVMQLAIRWPEF